MFVEFPDTSVVSETMRFEDVSRSLVVKDS